MQQICRQHRSGRLEEIESKEDNLFLEYFIRSFETAIGLVFLMSLVKGCELGITTISVRCSLIGTHLSRTQVMANNVPYFGDYLNINEETSFVTSNVNQFHFCRQHSSAHLVEISSKAENLFLKDFIRGFGGHCYWIGLTDELIEGNWVWYNSNTTPLFFDWYPTQPSPGDGEDCGVFWGPFDYKWGDLPCDLKCQPVCKISGGEPGTIVG